jgi:aspartyl-tRNA(Asn)/glutamyl-tRNA(Gln) amidotransferase subunit A
MITEELCFQSIADLARMIRNREVSPVEVVEAYLARVDRLNPVLNAFITVIHDHARAAAKQAEGEIAQHRYRGPLHGVPIGIKDILDTAGVVTTHGSSFFRTNVPSEDAASVERLKQAGAIAIGKCNTHEFAAGSTTNNPWYGAARNPWSLERSPGGSSGGSAAAVAAGMAAGAIGTDTGGSVRSPAACCGVVGLKPTYGRVSLRGVYPNAPSLDHVGPLARSARDVAVLLQGMAGYDARDPTCADVPVPDFAGSLDAGVDGLRLGLCPDLHYTDLDKEVAARLDAAIRVLESLGARVEIVRFLLRDDLAAARDAISSAELFSVHRERLAALPEGYGADVRARLLEAQRTTVGQYVAACRVRERARREIDETFQRVDALVLPVAPCEAPYLETGMSHINGREVSFGAVGVTMRAPINVLGVPAVSMPIGLSEAGLPLAMQIVGPRWHEARILSIAHAYEMATPALRSGWPAICGLISAGSRADDSLRAR